VPTLQNNAYQRAALVYSGIQMPAYLVPADQRRIFIFGVLGYFKLGALPEGMSYKLTLHVFVTFTEKVIPIHKHITSIAIPSISGTKTVTMTQTRTQRWSYMTTLRDVGMSVGQ